MKSQAFFYRVPLAYQLLLAGGIGLIYLRGRSSATEVKIEELSDDEKRRLADVLNSER